MERGNGIKDMVLESFEDLYKIGTVDEITLREIKALALKVKPYPPKAKDKNMGKFNFKKLIQSIEEMKLIRAGKLKPARVTSENEIREWMAKKPDARETVMKKSKAVNTKAIKVKIKK